MSRSEIPIADLRKAAAILAGTMLVEAWPLVLLGRAPGGAALLARFGGFGPTSPAPAIWAAALGIALLYAAVSMSSLPFIRVHLFDMAAIKLLAIPFALGTGTFEEVFFRAWLMNLAAAKGFDGIAQVAVSALAFGVVHGVWGLFGGGVRAAVRPMLFTGALGAALAILYLSAGRAVAPCVISHSLINLIIEPWLLLGVMALRQPQTA